jgi:hypothetical protein
MPTYFEATICGQTGISGVGCRVVARASFSNESTRETPCTAWTEVNLIFVKWIY